MSYRLEFSRDAQRTLRKLDKHQAALITRWLYQHVDGVADPRAFGKGLTTNRSGEWRYRVGNYRVLVDIQEARLVVLALQIGRRRNIYD